MIENVWAFAATVLAGFFGIMNPLTNAPVFVSLTDGLDRATQRKIAAKSTLMAFLIVAVFCVFGKLIFQMFGLTVPAFRITGGMLVFLVAFQLIQGQESKPHTPVDATDRDEKDALSLAISPLATPLLAGPGTIVTAMNFVADKRTIAYNFLVLGIFALVCLLTYLAFVSGEEVMARLGQDTMSVISRMMGLILAVIGVRMISLGIYGSVQEGIKFLGDHAGS